MRITVLDKHGSAWREPTERPMHVQALGHFDPNVKLVFNRAAGCFQLVREVTVGWHYHLEGFGPLCFIDKIWMWEMDCRDPAERETWGIEVGDDPTDLILRMVAGDTWDNAHLRDSGWSYAQIMAQRKEMEEKVSDAYRHNQRFNRRQLLRMWQPFHDYTGFVR